MSKKCIMIELSVFVDTDIESVDYVVNSLEFSVKPLDECVDVNKTEIENYYYQNIND